VFGVALVTWSLITRRNAFTGHYDSTPGNPSKK
jgi:hypothetical protein